MKLVIFGLTITSSWGNGHATLWRGLCGALVRARHCVTFFERNTPYYALNRDWGAIPGGTLVLYDEWETARARAMREVAEADAVIVTSYCPDALAVRDLALAHGRGVNVFYDLDTPITLARVQQGESVPYVRAEGLAAYDLVLSYTGGAALEGLKAIGARRAVPLYGHVDPKLHRPAESAGHYRADLSYLGTYSADRQTALERLFIAPARKRPDLRFVVAGTQYPPEFPWCESTFFVRHLPPGEHAAFFSSSRLTLNVTRKAMAEMGWCPSGRLFEAAACGTPILSDFWEGLATFFAPGEEIVIARDTDDTLAALAMSDRELRRIAKAGRERTLAEHTSDCRVVELIAALEEARAPSPLQAAGG